MKCMFQVLIATLFILATQSQARAGNINNKQKALVIAALADKGEIEMMKVLASESTYGIADYGIIFFECSKVKQRYTYDCKLDFGVPVNSKLEYVGSYEFTAEIRSTRATIKRLGRTEAAG